MIPRPILTRIPGEIPKRQSERYVEDFNKLSKAQLLELRDRQVNLLVNRHRVSKLPDKGKRIQDFYNKIQAELVNRDEVEKAANLFSDLNIASTGQEKLNALEWTGSIDPDRGEAVLDSDDENEEVDPLKIIAQGTIADTIVKYVKPEKSLITEQDLKEIQSFEKSKLNESGSSGTSSTSSLNLEPHALYLMEKSIDQVPAIEKFKPYKTTISDVHDPEKEKLRKKGKYWENTSATPPLIIHAAAKLLSLHDSVEIEAEYRERLKKLQEKQAQERLAAKQARMEKINPVLPEENVRAMNKFFGAYREEPQSDSDSDLESEQKIDSDDEVVDEVEDHSGVNYKVYK